MKDYVLTDEFGRKTLFQGEHLVYQTTDTTAGDKPQWMEVDVWRTLAGNYVVQRRTCYRVRHLTEVCSRADGYELVPATATDTYNCPVCNKSGSPGGWAQVPRTTVDSYDKPQDLILGFSVDGRYNYLARTVLAEVSDKDDRVDEVWNTVIVP